jgi:hypothetical protein
MNDLKNELQTVYLNRVTDFQHILDLCPESNISGPFLMSPKAAYSKQKFPFLAIGQQTNGWEAINSPVTKEKCERVMDVYKKFEVGKDYLSTPFWNVIRKIEAKLGNEPYSCEWTNINKYDLENGKPDAEHERIFSTVDNLLLDEMRIMKPKVCIFFTGHAFDGRIKNIFEEVEFLSVNGFEIHQFCRLKHEELPLLTFRTYHPRYLRLRGLEDNVIEYVGNSILNS